MCRNSTSLKSSRYVAATPYTECAANNPLQRFHNEVHVCTLLRSGDVETVPLVGAYSTKVHSFGLVYEYMDGLDLRKYLENEPNTERLKLVPILMHQFH